MRVIRKTYDGRFKAKVALEAIKGEETISQIASKYNVHPSKIGLWKKQVLKKLPELFSENVVHVIKIERFWNLNYTSTLVN